MKTTTNLKRFFCGISHLSIALSLALLLGTVGSLSSSAAGGAEIHAVLDQTEIGAREQATLTVSVSGPQAESPTIPRVDGLTIIPAGRSSRFESVNGHVSQSVEFIYTVQPSRPGDFTIPSIILTGTSAATEPLHLTVVASTASRSGRLPAPQAGTNAASQDASTAGPAFLKVYPTKNRLYMGEVVPVDIMAFFRQGNRASVQAAPQLSGSAFSLTHHTEKPQQTQETVNGEPYTVLTWHETLCGLKEGEYPLGSALEVTMAVPEKSRRSPRASLRGMFDDDDFFNDAFFDNFFSSMQEKNVRLESGDQTIRVLPLPVQGRPAGFSGAIGRFTIEASAKPDKVTVGDPVTLTLSLKGRGNFDRLALTGLADADGWKTYAPCAKFKPGDGIGYEGEKEFEQAVIPKDASRHEIPPVLVCYFNPDSHSYVTISTKALPVRVDPAQTAGRSTSALAAAQKPSVDSSEVKTEPTKPSPEGGLAPLHIEYGSPIDSLRPLLYRPWFLGLQAVPLLLLAVGAYLHRPSTDGTGRVGGRCIRQAVKKSVADMDRAIAENNAPVFFNSCRHAAQISLGKLWGIPAAAITLADIEQRLNGQGAGIRQVFETADAVAYSGRPLSQNEMRHCQEIFMDELTKLEKNHAAKIHY